MNQILEIIEEENTHVEGLCVACHRIYQGSERLGEREGGVKVELKPRTGGPRGSGEFGAFSPFRGESGREEAFSGSFLGREGPQKIRPLARV